LKSQGWSDYELYADPGFSGKNLERPAIGKLIKDCEDGKIDTVLVFKLDRLSRSQKDTLYLIEEVFNNIIVIIKTEKILFFIKYSSRFIINKD